MTPFSTETELIAWLRQAAQMDVHVPAAHVLEALEAVRGTAAREEGVPADPSDLKAWLRTAPATAELSNAQVCEILDKSEFQLLRLRKVEDMEAKGLRPLPFQQPDGRGGRVVYLAGELREWMGARVPGDDAPRLPREQVSAYARAPGRPRGATLRKAS